MPVNRYFVEGSLKKGTEVTLQGDEFHHIKNVIRKEPGDNLELINGKGAIATANLTETQKRHVTLSIIDVEVTSPPKLKCRLYQALTRHSKLDWILEKGTELGIHEFILFPSELSDKRELSSQQQKRAKHLTISALKQSGRLFLPKVSLLDDFPDQLKGVYYGDLSDNAPPLSYLLSTHTSECASCLIGPESGLTRNELDYLKREGAVATSLSDGILRAETAAVTAAGQLNNWAMNRTRLT